MSTQEHYKSGIDRALKRLFDHRVNVAKLYENTPELVDYSRQVKRKAARDMAKKEISKSKKLSRFKDRNKKKSQNVSEKENADKAAS